MNVQHLHMMNVLLPVLTDPEITHRSLSGSWWKLYHTKGKHGKKSSYWSFSLSSSAALERVLRGGCSYGTPSLPFTAGQWGKIPLFPSLLFLYFLFLSRNNFQHYSQNTPSAVSVPQINLHVYKMVRTSFMLHMQRWLLNNSLFLWCVYDAWVDQKARWNSRSLAQKYP